MLDLQSRDMIIPSYVIDASTKSNLGDLVGHNHNDLSGFYPLADGVDAFVARLALIESAQHTIDVQYYLYHRQQTTKLFTAYLLAAAKRGVRVRLLLDDMSQADSAFDLGALAHHPNFSVRLFNPFPNRSLPALGFITNFKLLSRRMHNKSFIVDNQVVITGGRNMGNAYYAGEDHAEFIDLDVLAVGKIVPEASIAFDLYWNHELAYPIQTLQGESDDAALLKVANYLQSYVELNNDSNYVQRLRASNLVTLLDSGHLDLDWQQAEIFYDHPDKLLNEVGQRSANMSPHLFQAMGEPKHKVIIVSPYFIPQEQGVKRLTEWAQQGVEVIVLTNSLAATDVAAVHAGYGHYRAALLRGGVKLWELKPSDLAALEIPSNKIRKTGSSQASLHAKTMTIDDSLFFVGSLNLDPRSFELNTEMGVLVHSEKLSMMLSDWVDSKMKLFAWQLELKNPTEDALVWRDIVTGEIFKNEPQTSSWRRFQVWFMSLFPIEDAL
ncbi:phospholipase D family protein [Pseudoalteromonas prydzensis]|uniref:phospholipase D family protein n=1 Tax=Pseudoalteromonas prydzensis TaxID=182141 RepID=UPI003704AD62